MRQALLVGARPLIVRGKQFPKVPLDAGGWKIMLENFVQSKVILHTSHPPVPEESVVEVVNEPDKVLILQGPITVSAEITGTGDEDFVSVYAVPI